VIVAVSVTGTETVPVLLLVNCTWTISGPDKDIEPPTVPEPRTFTVPFVASAVTFVPAAVGFMFISLTYTLNIAESFCKMTMGGEFPALSVILDVLKPL